jgi:hypothetical protein
MSMPVSFLPAAAPVSPAAAGATGGSDGGTLFGAVLEGLTPGSRDTSDTARDGTDPDPGDDTDGTAAAAGVAAGCAPPLSAGSAGLVPPSGDGRTPAPSAAGLAPARVPVAVLTPTSGATPVPPSTVDGAVPAVAMPAQPAGPASPAAPGYPAPAAQAVAAAPAVAAATAGPATVATAAVAAAVVPPAPPSTVDASGTPSTVDAPAVTVAGAGPSADRPSAGDTGTEAGSGRQPDLTWTAAVAGPRTDLGTGGLAPTASEPSHGPQAPPLPPAAQVALKLAPLRVGPDGTHQMTIVLNPEELGPISVVAQVRGDELSVRLTGTTVGADALKAALPQLQEQLRDGGFSTVAVEVREAPRFDPALRPAWAGPASTANSATDNATFETATTTSGAKTESQPIGQVDHPDGLGNRHHARHDLATGMYNAAGQPVTGPGTGQPAGQQGQHGQHHGAGQHQPGNQLNLGQPGNQPSGHQPNQAGQYGTAEQHHGGQQPGRNAGTERLAGRPEFDERDQRTAEHRPTTDRAVTRSVDLRV